MRHILVFKGKERESLNDSQNPIQPKTKLRRSRVFSASYGRRGFTLAEILVAVAIMGVVVAGVTSAIVALFQNQAGLVDKNEANEFVASFSRYLQTESLCSVAFNGMNFPAGNTTGVELVLPNYNGMGVMMPPAASGATAPTIRLEKGVMITPRVRISKLIIRDKGTAPIPVTSISGTPAFQHVAQVEIETEQKTQSSSRPDSWTKMRPRFVEFPVVVGASGTPDAGRIRACQVDGELENACTLIGGVYNPTTRQCEGDTQCQLMGTYFTSRCSPSYSGCEPGKTNQITGGYSCPAEAVASNTGRLRQTFRVSCGKKCTRTITHTMNFYVCLKCR